MNDMSQEALAAIREVKIHADIMQERCIQYVAEIARLRAELKDLQEAKAKKPAK